MTTKDYADALFALAKIREDISEADVLSIRRAIINPHLDSDTVSKRWGHLCQEVDRLRFLSVGTLEPWDVDQRFGNHFDDHMNAEAILLDAVEAAAHALVAGPRAVAS